MSRHTVLAIAGWGWVALGPANASASGTATIWYEAGANCPGAARFLELVHHQAHSVELKPAVAGSPEVSVKLDFDGRMFQGRLEMTRATGRFARTMTASSCDELASALAFVVGLALRDGAQEKTAPVGQTAVLDPPPKAEPPEDRKPEEPLGQNYTQRNGEWKAWVGVQTIGTSTASLDWAFGECLFTELRAPMHLVFGPTVRLGMFHAEPTRSRRSEPTQWWSQEMVAGRGEVAPVRVTLTGGTDLVLFGGPELGSVRLRSDTGRDEYSFFWIDMRGGLRVELLAWRWIAFEVQVELTIPIMRPRFHLAWTDYQVPALSGAVAGGLAIPIW